MIVPEIILGLYGSILGALLWLVYRQGREQSTIASQVKRLVSHYESERRSRSILSGNVRDMKNKVDGNSKKIDQIDLTLYKNGEGLVTRVKVLEVKQDKQ